MLPDPSNLLNIIGIENPLIGVYDAPEPAKFKPLIRPVPGKWLCVFACYNKWMQGETLHLTGENFGCGGAGHWICGVETRTRQDYIKFLVDEEGLKASHNLMDHWLDYSQPYQQKFPNILIGSLRNDQYEFLKTITFFIKPDQLGMLMLGAQYYATPDDPTPVLAPFGSGCMEMLSLFENLDIPQAIIGTTDIAMRKYLPPDILAFTVTRSMYEKLCSLDKKSFLYKSFWKELNKARKTT